MTSAHSEVLAELFERKAAEALVSMHKDDSVGAAIGLELGPLSIPESKNLWIHPAEKESLIKLLYFV